MLAKQPETAAADRLLRAGLSVLVFVVVLVLFPYVRDPSIDAKILVCTWGGGILTGICVFWYWRRGVPFRRPALFHGVLLVLFTLFAVSGLLSNFVGNSIQEISRFLALYLLYFVALQVYRTPEQVERLILVTCVAVGLSVAYGILQHQGWDPFPWNPSMTEALNEAPGTFGNGNIAAHTTVLCVVMAVYLAFSRGRRYWLLAFVVLYLVHLDLSNQRGGIVGIAAAGALVALAMFLYRRLKRPRTAIVASLVVLALLGTAALAGVMGLMQLRTGIPYPTGIPILLRYHGYSGASRMILEHPLLGRGPGNYRYENPAFWTPFEQEHFALNHKMNFRAHNDALEIGTEAGLPAAGLYLTFLLLGIYYGLLMGLTDAEPRRRKGGLFFAAFFCTFMVDGFFGFNLRVPVSGMLLFLMAGAFEGVGSGEGPSFAAAQRTGQHLARVALPVLAFGLIVYQSVIFASEMLLQRGAGFMYSKAFDQAEPIFAEGESLAPWNWEFAFDRGEASLRLYKPRETIAHYERALPRNPYYPPLYTSLAHAYLMLAEIGIADRPIEERLKAVEQAAAYAGRALEICPVMAEAEDMLGRCACMRATLLAGKKGPGKEQSREIIEAWREATRHLRLAIKDKIREEDHVYLTLARAEMALGDKLAAQDALVRTASSNPASQNLWPAFKQFADATGQQQVFRDVLLSSVSRLRREGKEIPPDIEAVSMLHGKDVSGLRDAARALAQAAVERKPKEDGPSAKTNYVWAAELILKEASSAALPDKEKAMIQYYAGLVYASAAQWQGALDLFGGCWKLLPSKEQTDCVMSWVQVLARLNQTDQAVAILREAISQTSGNAQLQLTLARTLAKNGRNAEARIAYEFLLNRFDLEAKGRNMIQQELETVSSTSR